MREFKILNKENVDWLFIDQHAGSKQYISYRHFIEQILFQFLKSYHFMFKNNCMEECKKAFKDFLAAYQQHIDYPSSGEHPFKLSLRLYWFSNMQHAALVDDTKHCFPLVMDSDARSAGLYCALRNINKSLDNILQILNQNLNKDWDEELQNEMNKLDDRQQPQKAA